MRCDATGPSVYVVPGMPNNRGETSHSPGGRPLPARLSDFIAARTSNAQRIVSYPPTAADFHTIKDGPPSTLCRHSARRLEAGGPLDFPEWGYASLQPRPDAQENTTSRSETPACPLEKVVPPPIVGRGAQRPQPCWMGRARPSLLHE